MMQLRPYISNPLVYFLQFKKSINIDKSMKTSCLPLPLNIALCCAVFLTQTMNYLSSRKTKVPHNQLHFIVKNLNWNWSLCDQDKSHCLIVKIVKIVKMFVIIMNHLTIGDELDVGCLDDIRCFTVKFGIRQQVQFQMLSKLAQLVGNFVIM